MTLVEMIPESDTDMKCPHCENDMFRIGKDTVDKDDESFIRIVCTQCHNPHLIRIIPV